MNLLRRGSKRRGSIVSLIAIPMFAAGIAPLVLLALLPGPEALRLSIALSGGLIVSAVGTRFAVRRLRSPLVSMANALRAGRHARFESFDIAIDELSEVSTSIEVFRQDFESMTARLVHKAFHDPLTALPNRALFMKRLQRSLEAGDPNGGNVGVLFVDLDRFKVINDSLGHEMGDRLLAAFAERMATIVQPGGTFARLGGDEFVLLLRSANAEEESASVAREILNRLREPFVVLGREMFVSASIGIATSSKDVDGCTELLRRADVALYRAKSLGRSCYIPYDVAFDLMPLERLDLETALRRALQQRELVLYYQPQCDLVTGDVVGTEALLRWNHPHRGILSPADFIGLAEETGDIQPIGRWVLHAACEKAAQLNLSFDGQRRPLTIAVNLSAAEFRQARLVEHIAHTLASTALEPAFLCIELTESTLMENLPEAVDTLTALKGLGVRIAIDDFGAGYSSFNYLQKLPVDILKIDSAFIRSIGKDKRSLPIVEAILQLGRALDLQVIAEGVETRAQVELLRSVRCPVAQGFYFGTALDAATIDDFLYQASLARELVA